VSSNAHALLTVDDVRQRLGGNKSRRWVLDQARSGRLPALKIGAEWRFHWQTILARLGKSR
jgi:hypothetical protein